MKRRRARRRRRLAPIEVLAWAALAVTFVLAGDVVRRKLTRPHRIPFVIDVTTEPGRETPRLGDPWVCDQVTRDGMTYTDCVYRPALPPGPRI